jgi:hypothetical protein
VTVNIFSTRNLLSITSFLCNFEKVLVGIARVWRRVAAKRGEWWRRSATALCVSGTSPLLVAVWRLRYVRSALFADSRLCRAFTALLCWRRNCATKRNYRSRRRRSTVMRQRSSQAVNSTMFRSVCRGYGDDNEAHIEHRCVLCS